MKYKVGDVIQIVDSWVGNMGQNSEGEMDYMLGNTYRISEVGPINRFFGQSYRVEGHLWHISEIMIVNTMSKPKPDSKKLYITHHTLQKIKDSVYNSLPLVTNEGNNVFSVPSDKTFGSTFEKPIVLGTEGNFFLRGKESNKIKLGKILGALYPGLTATEIEGYVSSWKKRYTINLDNVRVSSDIQDIYDLTHASAGDLGGSCMRNKGYLMKPYEALGCKVAYMIDDYENRLLARAILWEELEDTDGNRLKAIDRIFASDENSRLHLQKWGEDNGYYNIKSNKDDISVHTVKTLEDCFFDEGVPYIDTMYQLDSSYRLTNYNDYYGTLQNTDGQYECYGGTELCDTGKCECEHCGNTYDQDDLFYSNYHNEYLCDECSVWSDVMGDYIIYDEAISYDNGSDYVHEDKRDYYDIYCCYSSGDYYSADNLIFCWDIDDYVHVHEEYFWVEEVEEYYYNVDGLYYCEYDSTYWLSEETYTEHLEQLLREK